MPKPSKLTIGDISLEISPDMTPEQIQAMIQSVAALRKDLSGNVKSDDVADLPVRSEQIDPLEILTNGTWLDRIALFVRNEFGFLEFTVNDVQVQFHALFGKILEKAAITTYLNRLVQKGFVSKRKLPGNRVFHFQAQSSLFDEYPEVDLEGLASSQEVKTRLNL